MNYTEFKNNFQHLPVIFSKDILMLLKEDRQAILNQLNRWQDKGLIVKLRRGGYLLNKNDRKINPSRQFIANQLYGPSYISLEYALNLYGLIPERVIDLTSVTTKKTMRFKNELGEFIYQHIKPAAFRGFKIVKDESLLSYFIAEPEKAVVDFLYLNLKEIPANSKDIFQESFRFQNVAGLKSERIIKSARLFNSRKLMKVAKNFCEFVKKEGIR